MSSSSTYNNVLSKSPVQTQAVAAPKRDFQHDYSANDFSQTFKELRDQVPRKEETFAKAATERKNSVAENRRSADLNNAKKMAKESRSSRASEQDAKEASSRDDEHRIAKDKKISHKTTAVKDSRKPEEHGDEQAMPSVLAEPVKTNTTVAELTSAVSSDEVTLETAVDGAPLKTPDPLIETLTTTLSQESADESTLTEALNSELILDGDIKTAGDVNTLGGSSITTNTETIAGNFSPTVVQQIGGETTQTDITQNTAASISSMMNASPKSLTNAPVDGVNGENAAVTNELDAAADDSLLANETSAAQEDPKSVFEKMLQSVAKTGTREDSAPLSSLQNSANNSQQSPTDAFARFNDAQTPATRGFVVQTAVPVPVGQLQWSQAVGEKVLWLAAQNVTSAEINLHPKDLGPMQVKVSVNQEQTSVSFTSHHPMVREVLDQNLGRLRDMFSEQGLNLVNVDVSDKSFSRQQGEGKEQKGQSGTNNVNDEEAVTAVTTIVQQRLVDHYA